MGKHAGSSSSKRLAMGPYMRKIIILTTPATHYKEIDYVRKLKFAYINKDI